MTPTPKPPLDWTKPLVTRNGSRAIYLGPFTGEEPYCHQVATEDEGGWSVDTFTEAGYFHEDKSESDYDLFNVVPEKKLVVTLLQNKNDPENIHPVIGAQSAMVLSYWTVVSELEVTFPLNDQYVTPST